MAKRKAKTKAPAKKVRPKLDTAFTCPFCNAGTLHVHSDVFIHLYMLYMIYVMGRAVQRRVLTAN